MEDEGKGRDENGQKVKEGQGKTKKGTSKETLSVYTWDHNPQKDKQQVGYQPGPYSELLLHQHTPKF